MILTPQDERARWQALLRRTPAGGRDAFFYGVRTTGVFCRVGCASRLPRREHVEFFDTCGAALAAGYRPCKRCTPGVHPPQMRLVRLVEDACRTLERATPKLAELAAGAGLSPAHFHRVFKACVGVTPAQYARGEQARRFRAQLETAPSVTDAVYEAGFGASSRAYESARDHLAMSPTRFRRGAPGLTIRYGVTRCALGWLLAAATERGICAVELGDDVDALRAALQSRFPRARIEKADEAFAECLARIARSSDTPARGADLPLDIRGTAFQQRVWRALRAIPPGQTVTYTELAARIGAPRAVRAVARACAANPLALLVPCHRVVRSDGAIAGYRWGVERKRALLARERGLREPKRARSRRRGSPD